MSELDRNLPRWRNRRWFFASYLASFAIYFAIMLIYCSAPWGAAVAIPFVFPWTFLLDISYSDPTKLGIWLLCGLATLTGVLASIVFSLIWPRRLPLSIAHVLLIAHWSWSMALHRAISRAAGGFMSSGAW